jgi:hypothetical protein
MAIIPPFDQLTKIPAFGVDKIQQQFNVVTDFSLNQIKEVIKESVKLPTNIKCDDPRIKKIKQDLANIQVGITKIQESIPKIESAITTVRTIISTAQAINATVAAAQLAVPVTAGLFIAQQTMAIQNELIANAISAVVPLQNLPVQTLSKLNTLIPSLEAAISKLNTVCDDNVELNIPSISDISDESDESGVDINYNDMIPTEFYTELNVSDTDLIQRSKTIQQLVDQQRDLYNSLLEAPSQVYRQQGNPPPELGKIGDYYLNTSNNESYGPKISDIDWGTPIN